MSEQSKLLHKFHVALRAAVAASMRWRDSELDANMPQALVNKADAMMTRLVGAKAIMEASFPDNIVTGHKFKNDGPVALIEYTLDGRGARLYVHGILVRSVVTDAEVRGLDGLAQMINEAAQEMA